MDNENKWEYDYSNLYNNNNAGQDGYANVGSSGSNAANQYDGAPQYAAGGAHYAPAGPSRPGKPKKQGNGALRSVATVALAAIVGTAGGFLGGRLSALDADRVVVQTVERTPNSMTTTSTDGNDLSLPQVSALVGPSVVVITTEQAVYSPWSWYGQSVQSGAGSGVIISEDGYILTCAHVVSGASNIVVTIGDQDYTATVVGEDSDSDVAVIKIEATGLTAAVIGDSDALLVGEEVVAVGNPLGELGGTVTNGIISAVNRTVTVDSNEMSLLQTNASVSPGNSGGGLFNMAGELIGIVNAKSGDSDAEGLGFAIPINTAMEIAQELLQNGYVTGRPALGVEVVEVTNASTAQQLGVSNYGVYIVNVNSGGAADRAGLQPGDRIVSIDNTEVTCNNDLTNAIQRHAVGDTVTLGIARNGQIRNVEVTLGERDAPAASSTAN